MIFSITESLCDMMEFIIFNITFTCIIVIACNLFIIETNDALSFPIIVALADVITLVGLSFIYFYVSERITSKMMEIGDIFYHSAWYRLPTKQQSCLILPIQRAQREFRLRGLGLYDCSLPVFFSVWQSFYLNKDRNLISADVAWTMSFLAFSLVFFR